MRVSECCQDAWNESDRKDACVRETRAAAIIKAGVPEAVR